MNAGQEPADPPSNGMCRPFEPMFRPMKTTHPAHWRSYVDPSRWFRVWHPPGWTLVESGGEAQLVAPGSGGLLRLVGRWRSNWNKVDFDTVVDPAQVFPDSR